MKLHAFLDRFTLGNGPPTGPLTTDENRTAEALRHEPHTEDAEPKEREPEESVESR